MAEVLTQLPSKLAQSSLDPTQASPTVTHNGPKPGLRSGDYGERLVVSVIDELAERSPDRVWATISKSSHDIDKGFRDISFRDLAAGVNHVAWLNHNQFGNSNNFEVIAYFGVSDVRYAIYMFGAIKTGHQFMVPSVRNSLSQHLAVFDEAKCNHVYYTPEMESRIRELQRERPQLRAFSVESFDTHITSEAKHYEYSKTWAEARTDPIVVAHSSGSTGNPKPTTITNGVYSTYDSHRMVPPVPGRRTQSYQLLEFEGGGRFFNPFPPFHLAGLFAMTIMPVFYNCTVALGPPEKPPSGELVSKAMKLINIRAAWCPPSVIEQLVDLPGGFEQAASLDWIMYTGGPLAPAAGDRLCRVTDVCQLYGSTETGPHLPLVPLPENWNYFEWHPLLVNEMEPMGDGTFEMVVRKDSKLDWIRHLSQAYPDLEVWRTNDLFVQAPHNPNLWRFVGRRDDVLVLSNGEKFNPVNMEGTITGHPLVRGSLIVGTARIQASLIVEPDPEVNMSEAEFIENIWPSVEEANKVGPAHGRIFRSKVVVAKTDKPFKRAGKGTVIRGLTTKMYAEEVDQLYKDDGTDEVGAPTLENPESLEAVLKYVRSCLERLLSTINLKNDDDIFVLGMDSLQTSELAKSLQKTVASHLKDASSTILAPSHVYAVPTTHKLATFLHNVLNGEPTDAITSLPDRTAEMASLFEKFTADFEKSSKSAVKTLRIAVTGTTGSLGTRLLETFLKDRNVETIYCINRSNEAQRRHEDDFKYRGVDLDLSSKAVFMQMSPGTAKFGLSTADYGRLVNECDAIVHNAWKVNFNHKLSSFGGQIAGVRDLVDLSLASGRKPHIFFVSSLSSVGNWSQVRGIEEPVTEKVLDDFSLALPMGYGESKHVSERILTEAVMKVGANASVLRVGQVAGPLAENGGEWHKTEWFPSLIQTSKALGCLPNSMNTIDWIPVDTLSQIISEIVQHACSTSESKTYNLVNPHVAVWDDLVDALRKHWNSVDLKVVPFEEWLSALRGQSDPEKFPALKIIDFYEGLAADAQNCKKGSVNYKVDHGLAASKTMDALGQVDGAAMETWLKQWNL